MMSSLAMTAVHVPTNGDNARPLTGASHPDTVLVLLPPGHHSAPTTVPGHGVLLLVITGNGTLTTHDGAQDLSAGVLLWLPHGAARSVEAGNRGLAYLTVRR
jgi:quercetin dioxygenase-like cupin family protein